MNPPKKTRKKYWHLPRSDRIFDLILIAAVLAGLALALFDLLSHHRFPLFIRSADAVLIGVFLFDIGRTFFRSRSFFDFFHHHWLDLLIFIVIVFSLSSIIYPGLGRLSWLAREERVLPLVGRFFGRFSALGFLRNLKKI